MRFLAVLVVLTASLTSNAQEKGTEYVFKEIGWKIALPSSFQVVGIDSALIQTQKGTRMIEDANDVRVDLSTFKVLIYAKKGASNFFQVSLDKFDGQKDRRWDSTTQAIKDLMYYTLSKQMPDAKFDSASSTLNIDWMRFDEFVVRVSFRDNAKAELFVLSNLYRGYQVGITYLCLDEPTRSEIEDMLKRSTFSK
jgi:hypothetical protein